MIWLLAMPRSAFLGETALAVTALLALASLQPAAAQNTTPPSAPSSPQGSKANQQPTKGGSEKKAPPPKKGDATKLGPPAGTVGRVNDGSSTLNASSAPDPRHEYASARTEWLRLDVKQDELATLPTQEALYRIRRALAAWERTEQARQRYFRATSASCEGEARAAPSFTALLDLFDRELELLAGEQRDAEAQLKELGATQGTTAIDIAARLRLLRATEARRDLLSDLLSRRQELANSANSGGTAARMQESQDLLRKYCATIAWLGDNPEAEFGREYYSSLEADTRRRSVLAASLPSASSPPAVAEPKPVQLVLAVFARTQRVVPGQVIKLPNRLLWQPELRRGDLRARITPAEALPPDTKIEIIWLVQTNRSGAFQVVEQQVIPPDRVNEWHDYRNTPTAGQYLVELRVNGRVTADFAFELR
jgi:hypothetical protein